MGAGPALLCPSPEHPQCHAVVQQPGGRVDADDWKQLVSQEKVRGMCDEGGKTVRRPGERNESFTLSSSPCELQVSSRGTRTHS